MSRNQTTVVIAVAAVILLILGTVLVLLFRDLGAGDEADAITAGTVVAIPSGPATRAATRVAVLPPPAITILPTSTPRPTDKPTATTEATATAEPTKTAPPTAIPPTFAAVLPTATAVPPTATAAPGANTQGIVATHFALQSSSVFQVGQPVWFEFTLPATQATQCLSARWA
jgi:hypothetical protein